MSDHDDTSELTELKASWQTELKASWQMVKGLGDCIGYGALMSLAEKVWRQNQLDRGEPGGAEHSHYCCASFLVPCPGCEPSKEVGEHCEWCCGAGRVTKRVAASISLYYGKARHRLRGVAPHLDIAAGVAEIKTQGGKAELAIVASNSDGSGRVTARFELREFMRDLYEVLEEESEASASPAPPAAVPNTSSASIWATEARAAERRAVQAESEVSVLRAEVERLRARPDYKPCPFCGSRKIRMLPQQHGFSVDCIDCGAMVRSVTRYKRQAQAEWNKRREPEPL